MSVLCATRTGGNMGLRMSGLRAIALWTVPVVAALLLAGCARAPKQGGTPAQAGVPKGSAKAASPAAVGQVDLKGVLPTSPSRDSFVKRVGSKALDKGVFDDWEAALGQATGGQAPDRASLFMFLPNVNPLFTNDEFQPEVSKVFTARLRDLQPSDVEGYMAALAAATGGSSVSKQDAVIYLIQLENLFEGPKLRREALETQKSRLKLIPKAALDEWASARSDAKPPQIAATLAAIDQLFADGKFQPDVSAELLRQLKQQPL